MLYSIIPPEIVFKAQEEELVLEERAYLGRIVQCCACDEGFVIERLLSANLRDYTDPRFQPGNIVPASQMTNA